MSRTYFYIIVCLFVVLGLGTAWMRHITTGEPFFPGEQTQVWQVEAKIDFVADGPTLVSLALPDEQPDFLLLNEQAASPGYGFSFTHKGDQRRGEWTKRDAIGPQTLYYKAELIFQPGRYTPVDPPLEVRQIFWREPVATAVTQLLDQALQTSSDAQSLVREIIKQLNNPKPDQNTALILEQHRNRAHLLDALINQAGIASRVELALYLEDARRQQPLIRVLRVQGEEGTFVVNPQTGEQEMTNNLLIWSSNEHGLLDVAGGYESAVRFAMIKRNIPAQQLAKSQAENSIFNLLGVHLLPIEAQSMFKMLFLLPIGALVIVFMRLIVGVQTAGTFMPVLIALAFLQTSLLSGLASFIFIVAFGLVLRSYLSHLNLLMVARISTLIVLVITIIAFMSLISYELGIGNGVSISFFPMIIIAWTIERMSILWEEEGPRDVLIQGSGSLLVATLSYLLMKMPLISHLSFNFPELNLVIIAAILLMGQYTGYRLSELKRFRDLALGDKHAD